MSGEENQEINTLRFAAQPGGAEVGIGEAEIVARFPAADSFGHYGSDMDALGFGRMDLWITLDTATARHLAAELGKITPSEEQELAATVNATRQVCERTGDRPLAFEGEEIARADGQWAKGRERNRWYELALYRTRRCRYVLAVRYRTRWQGEIDHDAAIACHSLEEVAACLRDYDPLSPVAGFPPGAAYEARQARLQAEIESGYRALVAELLKRAGAEETIE